MYVMDHQTKWEEYLPLVEFSYNNRHHTLLGMPPYQALYNRPCRTQLSWDRIEDKFSIGPKIVQEMEKQMDLIRQRLREAQNRQKKYVDEKRIDHSYLVGDRVLLRVRPHKSQIHYGKGSKLTPHFAGPFEILERIGLVAYHLAFPPSLSCIHDVFHVSVLRKYIYDESHILDWDTL